MTATKYVQDTQSMGVAFSRPLCLYPAHSAYLSGNPNLASSYTCNAGDPVTNQGFAPQYGP
jgi:feruloyl esterase